MKIKSVMIIIIETGQKNENINLKTEINEK